MNQQREVIYSLRAFALEGGEELKGESLKMIERAVARRVETTFETFDTPEEWDPSLLRQDLLMHYLLSVPEFAAGEDGTEPPRPAATAEAQEWAKTAGREAFAATHAQLDEVQDETGAGNGARLLALVMLNVIDEKWKDHLYDLDQLRAAIHYRSWGQKDPLVEYKGEAYNMFVDLMNDVANTFTERFLKAQLVFDQPTPPEFGDFGNYGDQGGPPEPAPRRRYNALGILEDIPEDFGEGDGRENGHHDDDAGPTGVRADDEVVEATYEESAAAPGAVQDIGPSEPPGSHRVAKKDPAIVGAGAIKSFATPAAALTGDLSHVGRNDPCPCGSGKKFKKCHGAHLH
jgi:preprotein translocase subunit SecA